MSDDDTIVPSSGNVFADIGLPDPETHMIKARLVYAIDQSIKALGLSQVAAAERMGIKQPDLSKLIRGHHRGFTVERLLYCLNALGRDVEISVKKAPARRRRPAAVTLKVA